jgi:outer membrane protein assembly factor BamB
MWDFVTKGAVHSSPTLAIGLVIVGSSDEKVYALDIKTGHQSVGVSDGNGHFFCPFCGQTGLYM